MKLRSLYMLAGGAWGLALAPLAGFGFGAFAAGVAWIYVFGDDPWPAAAGPVILAGALAAGSTVFAACVASGYVYGKSREGLPKPLRERRRSAMILVAGLVATAALMVVYVGSVGEQTRERQAANEDEAAFAQFITARHAITALQVAPVGGDAKVRASLRVRGSRTGLYLLQWTVGEPAYGVTLQEDSMKLDLSSGEHTIALEITTADLATVYGRDILEGQGPAMVDTFLKLETTLTPVLSDTERNTMPERELGNLRLGYSQLIAEAQTDFALSFTVRAIP